MQTFTGKKRLCSNTSFIHTLAIIKDRILCCIGYRYDDDDDDDNDDDDDDDDDGILSKLVDKV